MSALPSHVPEAIATQDETHLHIRDLLTAATAALLEARPDLEMFEDHRPQRDRPSGEAWNGLETVCHVSALLVAGAAPHLEDEDREELLSRVDEAVAPRGLRRRQDREDSGVRSTTWRDDAGLRLDVMMGVRVAVRAISMPFLPGSLQPLATTSPASPISPLTPPPRPLR